MNPRIGWGQPSTGWGQPHLPGWAPLVDHGPLPLRVVSSAVRWWWPTLAVAGFLAVVVYVADHDHPGLSHRGLLTIALAALVVVLLSIHRRRGPGPLARAVTEYTVVALLATLLAVGGTADQQPANPAASTEARAEAAAGEDRPGVLQAGATVVRAVTRAARAIRGAVRWLADLWRKADQTQPTNPEEMAASPFPLGPSALSIWRSP